MLLYHILCTLDNMAKFFGFYKKEREVIMNKLGVEVKIFLNGKVIIPDGDGFLGNQFFRGDRILLELGAVIKRERGYICVLDVDGKKNISQQLTDTYSDPKFIFILILIKFLTRVTPLIIREYCIFIKTAMFNFGK